MDLIARCHPEHRAMALPCAVVILSNAKDLALVRAALQPCS